MFSRGTKFIKYKDGIYTIVLEMTRGEADHDALLTGYKLYPDPTECYFVMKTHRKRSGENMSICVYKWMRGLVSTAVPVL